MLLETRDVYIMFDNECVLNHVNIKGPYKMKPVETWIFLKKICSFYVVMTRSTKETNLVTILFYIIILGICGFFREYSVFSGLREKSMDSLRTKKTT